MKLTKEAFKNVLENKIDWNKVLIEITTTSYNKPVLIFNDGSFAQDHAGYEEDEILGSFSPCLNERQNEGFSDGWCEYDEETGDYITHKSFGNRTLTPDEMVIESIEEGDHEDFVDYLKINAFSGYFSVDGHIQDAELKKEYFSIEKIDISNETYGCLFG